MKKIILSVSLVIIAATSFGQMYWNLTFDDTTNINRILFDTSSNPNNIWQKGHPNKTVFISAKSSPNVVVTDTINSYPTNDTSSFTIIHVGSSGWQVNYPAIFVDGWYYVNSDTLTDYGYIEFSSDHGITWFRADSPTNHGCCFSGSEELPTFSGNSFGWKHFHYCLCTHIPVTIGDTVLYRFTFISDNVQTNKDGLMFDDLHFEDWTEGIDEIQNDNLITISPNPTSGELTIGRTKSSNKQTVQIFNFLGQILYDNSNFIGEKIDTRNLFDGMYLLKYSNTKYFSMKKFVVHH